MPGVASLVLAAIALVVEGPLPAGLVQVPHRPEARESPILLAADNGNEVRRQVPVVEQVEPPDSPSTDIKRGNAEAQMPSDATTGDIEKPAADTPPEPGQPPVEP